MVTVAETGGLAIRATVAETVAEAPGMTVAEPAGVFVVVVGNATVDVCTLGDTVASGGAADGFAAALAVVTGDAATAAACSGVGDATMMWRTPGVAVKVGGDVGDAVAVAGSSVAVAGGAVCSEGGCVCSAAATASGVAVSAKGGVGVLAAHGSAPKSHPASVTLAAIAITPVMSNRLNRSMHKSPGEHVASHTC